MVNTRRLNKIFDDISYALIKTYSQARGMSKDSNHIDYEDTLSKVKELFKMAETEINKNDT